MKANEVMGRLMKLHCADWRFAFVLACLLLLVPSLAGQSDSADERANSVLAHEIAALKTELRALQARVSEMDGDALQTRDALDVYRDEFLGFRARLDAAFTTSNRSPLTLPVDKERGQPRNLDVEVTGSLAQVRGASVVEQQQLRKAEQHLQLGDVATAQLFLEHALRTGNPTIAFRLAETYDPNRMAGWKVVGLRGDPQKARQLYQKALSGGVEEARGRLADLPW